MGREQEARRPTVQTPVECKDGSQGWALSKGHTR